jgi:hypothetical protein
MLSLYNLPGKILANLWYLWPKKGQVWASARRKDNRFVHFVYSTVVYAVLLYVAFAPRPQRAVADLQPSTATAAYSDSQDRQTETGPEPVETEKPLPADGPAAAAAYPRQDEFDGLPPLCSETITDRCMNPSEAPTARRDGR